MKTAIFAPFASEEAGQKSTADAQPLTRSSLDDGANGEKFGGRSTPSRTVPPRMSSLAAQQVTARLAARVARRLAKVRASSAPSRAPARSPLPPSAAHKNAVAFSRFSLVVPTDPTRTFHR